MTNEELDALVERLLHGVGVINLERAGILDWSALQDAADGIESLRQQLAECEWERNDAIRASMNDMNQLATVTRERDELKANSDRYELLREMKLYEMMEYRCLPVPIEDADDWFDAQTDAKIRERYPRATIGADKTGDGS